MNIPRVTALAVSCALAGRAVTVSALHPAPAHASTPPGIHVTLPANTDKVVLSYDGSPDGQQHQGGCTVHIGPKALTDQWAIVKAEYTISAMGIGTGAQPIYVVCGQSRSATVNLYLPRSATNDVRTQFSNTTQGMFGS